MTNWIKLFTKQFKNVSKICFRHTLLIPDVRLRHHNTDGVALPQISRKIALMYFYYSQAFIPSIQTQNVY